ncbi:hydrolase, NUDIX family protein [Besnoitia besnoiti]|uniref:Bis(5'-nucleosyl)-tetraphosphatase [asymmetrical] n=1 Tax=Besnoitia besnoiti TaxID=94643 RepID=A0A2A9MMQ8_BESBE|nr:hydrolase, NUDIX family protein [Besnoitia besnoiti]PFH37077.1 hydrolase, NUDIX family protein [Besnoitia besnoiti]
MAQAGDTETPRIETRAAGFLVYRQQSQDPEFLMMKASYEPFHWTPPKGHVDGTESALQTALRETREEAGISEGDLEIDRNFERRLHYVARGKNKETVYFLARVRNACKPVVLSDEHTEARWLSAEAAAAIGGFEDMARVLMEADAHIRTSRATQA